jgi:CheY-like chemotaxis protein
MKRILIVEDDAVLTSIYQQQYKAAGYSVATATDGESGLLKIQSFLPDLVQIDLLIPKINGVELIKKIRLQPEHKELPIIVLSSCYHELTVNQAWAAGANDVISKLNSSPKILLDSIEKLLNPSEEAPSQEGYTVDIRQEFVDRVPQFQTELRTRLQAFIKSQQNDSERVLALRSLYQTISSLGGHAGMSGFVATFHSASALEALLNDLQGQPQNITASVIRTIANGVDCLLRTLKNSAVLQSTYSISSLILCVDDEPISRQMISKSLMRVDLKVLSLDTPALALEVLARNAFDLIFLDVDMPEMDGFELCKKLRLLPLHQKTPVVFVTNFSGFDSRARSVLSGGNDLIAKPFLMMELAVKALTYIANAKIAN